MKLCDNIGALSVAYLDDELSAGELRDFELHLLECEKCRARVGVERQTLAQMRQRLAPPPMEDAARTRIVERVRDEETRTTRAALRARVLAWLLPAIASIVAIIALGLCIESR